MTKSPNERRYIVRLDESVHWPPLAFTVVGEFIDIWEHVYPDPKVITMRKHISHEGYYCLSGIRRKSSRTICVEVKND